MDTKISFKHMETSEFLKTFIEEKTATLKKYFHGNVSVTWNLSMEKQNRIAHCHLVGNHMDYFGEGTSDDFKASVDVAFDRIEKQVRKHKEVVKDHLHHNGNVKSAVSKVDGGSGDTDSE